MANQRRNWEDHGKELAAQMTDNVIAQLEEELLKKQARSDQLDEELRVTAVAQRLTERSQLRREITDLEEQLKFARDRVKPKLVEAAAKAGRYRNEGKTGCFG